MDSITLKDNNQTLVEIEKEIASNFSDLNTLSPSQIEEIAKLVVLDRYKTQMAKEIEIVNFDYNDLKTTFLKNCSKVNSKNTKMAYERAINDFEEYLKTRNVKTPLSITPDIADDYIYKINSEGRAPSSVLQYVGAISSFYTFLERRTNYAVKNVFKGSRAKPQQKSMKNNKFYNVGVNADSLKEFEKDIDTILENIDNVELKAIILIMKNCGLRVGAFENLSIWGNKYSTISKGKKISGTIPDNCLEFLNNASLKKKNPFTTWTADRTKNLFKYHTNKMYKNGLIKYPYSAHDIRHYFALSFYIRTKDIYSLSKLLHHSSISITERYLKGLNVLN